MKSKSILVAIVLSTSTLFNSVSIVSAKDSGGVPNICHYYSDNNYENYSFRCYSDMKPKGGAISSLSATPSGFHISKYIKHNHRLLPIAKESINNFARDLESAKANFAAYKISLAVAVISWETVVGSVLAGAAAVHEADAAKANWSSSRNNLAQAYNHIYGM